MNTDKFELKPVDMFVPSTNKSRSINSNTDIGRISAHKIVFGTKELCAQDDNIALIHIKSIKFSPSDFNKKSVKNLLCGELLYRIKRYLYHNEKVSIDDIIIDFNKKFKNIVSLDSIESIDAFLQNKLIYEQHKDMAKNNQSTNTITELGL